MMITSNYVYRFVPLGECWGGCAVHHPLIHLFHKTALLTIDKFEFPSLDDMLLSISCSHILTFGTGLQ